MENLPLNPDNVPKELVPLLPLAEKWGIGDDGDREDAVHQAPTSELEDLVQAVDGHIYETLDDWLINNARNENLPNEYYVLTSLFMAVESAKVTLKMRKGLIKPRGDEAARLDDLLESLRKHTPEG